MTRIPRIPALLAVFPVPCRVCIRGYSTSSKRWVARQRGDVFTREAKVQQFKSRAAFKLLEVPQLLLKLHINGKLNEKYHIFRPGQTVIDLVSAIIASLTCRASHQDPGRKSPCLKLILTEEC